MANIRNLSDKEIVDAILHRDTFITKEYLYKKCYPLFYNIYNKYYTDCEDVFEFINEIYIYVLTPNKSTGRCKLADFGFRCTLTMWLKIVAENVCHQLYNKKNGHSDEDYYALSDRINSDCNSLDMNFKSISRKDARTILQMMTNNRYRRLIEYRYLQGFSNEETAQKLEMSMDNYYNKHKLAKAQFCAILKKEGLI